MTKLKTNGQMDLVDGKCPICGNVIVYCVMYDEARHRTLRIPKYCDQCGQAINYPEVEFHD